MDLLIVLGVLAIIVVLLMRRSGRRKATLPTGATQTPGGPSGLGSGEPDIREDLATVVNALAPKQRSECIERRWALEEMSGYLRSNETVEFARPIIRGALLVITTQRLLAIGDDTATIPLSEIFSADAPVTEEKVMLPWPESTLVITIRGGRKRFCLSGTSSAREAKRVLQKTLMS
jgi:hypothetical protein